MSRKKIYSYCGLIIIAFFTWFFSNSNKETEAFLEVAKISLREVGNQLLLVNKDSTSLVLPILELKKGKYQLSFQNQLSFLPKDLISIVDSTFQKTKLPNHYRVEVIQCEDKEVAYSYEMSRDEANTIIPCGGRFLPKKCYTIEVRFIYMQTSLISRQMFLYLFLFIIFLFLEFFFFKKKQVEESKKHTGQHTSIGSFSFYPDQNKLVKEAVEISLSKKECELLEIFITKPNQIIKRDELTKRVWEDHGVIVGRSLDTYISKLRKKLKGDNTIKLTNVHGVGYKLEIS